MPFWDLTTVIIYAVMGIVPMWAIYETDNRMILYKKWWQNPFFIMWIIIWTIFAGGRFVGFGTGGTDAPAYMEYFENCWNPAKVRTGALFLYDLNIGFRWFNRLLRLVSSDGQFFITVVSFILVASTVLFLNKFKMREESCIPYFLIIFWYVRGFSSIRSHLATVTLLIALCLLFCGKKKLGIIVTAFSVLLHTMMSIYIPFVLLYVLYKDFSLRLKTVTAIFLISFIIIAPLKELFFRNVSFFGELSEHYESYVANIEGMGFFDNAWKIAFEQILLLAFILFSNKGLRRYAKTLNGTALEAYDFIYNLCLYDILLVPICYGFNIWRGYEVCYIPRLIMWALILHIGAMKFPRQIRWLYNFIVFGLFLAWFLQRTSSEAFWMRSSLMPYIFAPLIQFF